MGIVLFDEYKEVTYQLATIFKEKLMNVEIYTDLLCFLESFCDRNNFMDTIFVLSEDVLKNRNIRVDQLLKKFDCYSPILTYDFNNVFYLKLNINYVYEYQINNYKIFIDNVHKIEECFIQFANTKEDFLSCNFQCEELPIHLSRSKKKQEHIKLYERFNIQGELDMCLSKRQTKLFRLLVSRKEGISLEEIAHNLWEDDSKSKAQNIYILIHALKRVILQKTGNKYRIIHHNKKYQLVKTIESATSCSCCCHTSINQSNNEYSNMK